MPRELTKEITINGQKYQIARMDAMTGSWIALTMVTKLFPVNVETMMNLDPRTLPVNRSELSESEFRNIQTHCLKVVSRIDVVGATTAPIPILMANGDWADKELSTDIVSVLTLTAHALVFNVAPFFEEGALKQLLGSLSGLSQFNAPKI